MQNKLQANDLCGLFVEDESPCRDHVCDYGGLCVVFIKVSSSSSSSSYHHHHHHPRHSSPNHLHHYSYYYPHNYQHHHLHHLLHQVRLVTCSTTEECASSSVNAPSVSAPPTVQTTSNRSVAMSAYRKFFQRWIHR